MRFLQHRVGRVGNTRIDVAGTFLVEQRCGMLAVFEDVAGGEVDRGRPGMMDGIGGLAGVQGEGIGPGVTVDGHAVFCYALGMREA